MRRTLDNGDAMQRFYQGQLDFFCAIYAVVNALTALYGINLTQARALFASILYDISRYPDLWRTTLANKTDFHWLAAHMLLACGKGSSYPLTVFRPFADEQALPESAADLGLAEAYAAPSPRANALEPRLIWSALEDWLPATRVQPRAGSARRVAVLRFHRYIRYVETPIISHWTVADHHHGGVLHLRDASKEDNALHSLGSEVTAFTTEQVSEERTIRIEPESVFFLERR